MNEMEPRVERLQPMQAAYVHAFSATPEEDAQLRIFEWATSKNLIDRHGIRLFGRNTYPTENPEPHGYEYYLTLDDKVDVEFEGVETEQLPAGQYAVLRFTDLARIGEAWKTLWEWIEKSGHVHVGFKKGEHGWVDGFEEHLNWQEMKSPNKWVFDLWVQLKE